MNKLFIGLLIVAAGAGTFILLRKKTNTEFSSDIKKEWIIGKWKTNAVMANDSNFSKYQFDFQKNGNVIRSLNDSVKVDTSRYEWNKSNQLVWKEKLSDTTGKVYAVVKLTQDSLQVRSKDSMSFLFIKAK